MARMDPRSAAAFAAAYRDDDTEVVLGPSPFVARVLSVLPGPPYTRYQVVRLGAVRPVSLLVGA